jgi:hypothetical protein
MFDFFGFDPRTLTDDELLHKTMELQAKIVYASRFSSSGLLGNLQQILQAIEFERQERFARRVFNDMQSQMPDSIESDPDLATANQDKAQPDRGKIVPQPRPRMQITKTNRPVDPGEPGDTSK